jgi:AcrR family transcriptional regulator
MPKKPDAQLEGRILNAAYTLWERGGEKSLTMRAVAKAARTTTPTVYQRFRDKRDLLEAMRGRALRELVAAIEPAKSAGEVCAGFLEFAIQHPNSYRLLTVDWAVRLSRKERKPSFELIKTRLAERLGGAPEDHAELAMSLGALVHGTATMLLTTGVKEGVSRDLQRICAEGCEALIAHAESTVSPAERRRVAGPR